LLSHDGTAADRSKSNNRMISSIAWGVPAIVSRTPEYERTAREAGVTGALFDTPAQMVAAIERHRPAAARAAYLDRAQPHVWRHHAPAVVAGQLLQILHHHLGVSRAS
jgi:hypothetical protein